MDILSIGGCFGFSFLPVFLKWIAFLQLSLAELKMYSLMMSANGHVDSRGNLPPPIIMRTAATPMPTPKSSLGTDSIFSSGESRRGSGISIDPNAYDRRSLVSGFTESKEVPLIYSLCMISKTDCGNMKIF